VTKEIPTKIYKALKISVLIKILPPLTFLENNVTNLKINTYTKSGTSHPEKSPTYIYLSETL